MPHCLSFVFLRARERSVETLKSVKIDQNRPEPSKRLISLSPQRDAGKSPKRVQLRLVGMSIHTCNSSCLALCVREIRIFQCASENRTFVKGCSTVSSCLVWCWRALLLLLACALVASEESKLLLRATQHHHHVPFTARNHTHLTDTRNTTRHVAVSRSRTQ
jgi:hypothetical protein